LKKYDYDYSTADIAYARWLYYVKYITDDKTIVKKIFEARGYQDLMNKHGYQIDYYFENILEKCTNNVHNTLYSVSDIYKHLAEGIEQEDRKKLKLVNKEVEVLNHQAKKLKDNVYKVLKQLRRESISESHHYAQVLDYLRETAHAFTYLVKSPYEYFENGHSPLLVVQIEEIKTLSSTFKSFNNFVLSVIDNNSFSQMDQVLTKQEELLELMETYRKNQMKRLKHEEVGAKNSMLYLSILHESKNLILNIVSLTKAQRDFVLNANN